jgi:drug/metabolite transporter (DMT)-like permease
MSRRFLAVGGLLLTVVIWGTTFVATKVALRDLPPLTLTLLRFILASLVLVPLACVERRPAHRATGWRPLVVAGLLGGGLFFALQNLGLVYTTASKASLIIAVVPALTGLFSLLFLGERFGWARGLGVAASIAGVATIILAGGADGLTGGKLLGDLLFVATAVAWAAYTVLAKGLEGRTTPALLSAATVGFGALSLVPLAGYEALTRPLAMPAPAGWLALGYLGLVASTVPFLLWNYALGQIDAGEAAVYTNLVPLVAVASSVLLLHEELLPGQILGGALVLVGVSLASRQPRRSGSARAEKGQAPPGLV